MTDAKAVHRRRVLLLADAPSGWPEAGVSGVARAVASRLGPDRVVMLTGPQLTAAVWEHRIEDGAASTTLRWGRDRLETRGFGAVLNRIRVLAPIARVGATVADQAYAEAELQALFVSFLRAMPGLVLNRPDGQGAAGSWSAARWAALAQGCGFATEVHPLVVGSRLAPRRTPSSTVGGSTGPATQVVTVVGGQVIGAASPAIAAGCRALSVAAGCDLLSITFSGLGSGHQPRVLEIDPFPPLAPVSGVVAELLCGAVRGERVTT